MFKIQLFISTPFLKLFFCTMLLRFTRLYRLTEIYLLFQTFFSVELYKVQSKLFIIACQLARL